MRSGRAARGARLFQVIDLARRASLKVVILAGGNGQGDNALVGSVEAGGPAARAGVRAGDVIVQWNGRPVAQSDRLPLLVAETAPGAEAKATVIRGQVVMRDDQLIATPIGEIVRFLDAL